MDEKVRVKFTVETSKGTEEGKTRQSQKIFGITYMNNVI